MRNISGDWVDNDNLPTQPPGVVDRGIGAAAPSTIVDSQ